MWAITEAPFSLLFFWPLFYFGNTSLASYWLEGISLASCPYLMLLWGSLLAGILDKPLFICLPFYFFKGHVEWSRALWRHCLVPDATFKFWSCMIFPSLINLTIFSCTKWTIMITISYIWYEGITWNNIHKTFRLCRINAFCDLGALWSPAPPSWYLIHLDSRSVTFDFYYVGKSYLYKLP